MPTETCQPGHGVATCLEHFIFEPGVPFTLPVTMDSCSCCPEATCEVEVEIIPRRPPELRLTTRLCTGTCECDRCETAEAQCAVPALEEGAWSVSIDGAPAFNLEVRPDPPYELFSPTCWSYGEPDECAAPSFLRADPWAIDRLCLNADPDRPGRTSVTVISNCWPCGELQGPCAVTDDPYDDGPADSRWLHVYASHYPSTCDVDCPGTCERREWRCESPPLSRGELYDIRMGSMGTVHIFRAGEGDFCVDIDH